MGYVVSTKNHTYHFEDTNDPTIKLVSGGKYRQNEIKLLSDIVEGQPVRAIFTNNPSNKDLTGEILISDIISIRRTPYVQVARPNIQKSMPAENAGQFFVMDNAGRDISKILRQNRKDIEYGVEEKFGLPETMHQKIFISPTIANDGVSQCTVIFAHFDNADDVELAKSIQNEVISMLDDNCGCSEIMFIEKSHLHFIEQNYSDKALGLNVNTKLKDSLSSKPTMTSTTPILVIPKATSLSPSL